MIHPIRNASPSPRRTVAHGIAFALLGLACLHSPISRAAGDEDTKAPVAPGSEMAMPGLWKHDVSVVHNGQAGKPVTRWHCLLDDDDPWVEFGTHLTIPGKKCTVSDKQANPKGFSWNLTCSGHVTATAHVDFDTNEHYTGSIMSKKNKELVHVEGKHRAACTDPSD